MLNRYGHCISYHPAEEIETEMTFGTREANQVTPHRMIRNPQYGTGVAWDNFDRFVETESGKDILHDTVGIVYQLANLTLSENVDFQIDEHSESEYYGTSSTHSRTQSTEPSTNNIISIEMHSTADTKKRRRTYEPTCLEIEPYRKKPKLYTSEFHPIKSAEKERYETACTSRAKTWKQDVLWMIDFSTNPNCRTPM